jgi:hypothetical protein
VGLSIRKLLVHGDMIVMDILRNLLLIMSNRGHVVHYNTVICLADGKYLAIRSLGRIFTVNGFSHLQRILLNCSARAF